MKKNPTPHSHSEKDISNAISLFFALRGLMRTKFAHGKRLNPYAWLHVETMVFIHAEKGPSMRRVAEHLAITAPSATSLVGALIKSGLVRRERDARDARASRVYLTKEGQALLAKKKRQGAKLLAEVFSVLSPRELKAFSDLLERLLTRKNID